MNAYTQLLDYIKQLGEGDVYINTITKDDNVDLNKMDIYPLLNISVDDATFPSDATISFAVNVRCFAIRDINNEVVSDKFYEQDNEVDNLNETLYALNRIWRIMHRDFLSNNITSSDAPTLTKMTDVEKNRLDGWEMSFDIEMPYNDLDLCLSTAETTIT